MQDDAKVEAPEDSPAAKVIKAVFKKAELRQGWTAGPHDVAVLADLLNRGTAVNQLLTEKLVEYERLLTAVNEAPKRKLLKGVQHIWEEMNDGVQK